MFDDFKIGCEILAGFAQSFWDSLNVFEQIVAVIAGVIGSSLVLGCAGGYVAGLIGRWRRARREKADLPGPYLRDRLAGVDPVRTPIHVVQAEQVAAQAWRQWPVLSEEE